MYYYSSYDNYSYNSVERTITDKGIFLIVVFRYVIIMKFTEVTYPYVILHTHVLLLLWLT